MILLWQCGGGTAPPKKLTTNFVLVFIFFVQFSLTHLRVVNDSGDDRMSLEKLLSRLNNPVSKPNRNTHTYRV